MSPTDWVFDAVDLATNTVTYRRLDTNSANQVEQSNKETKMSDKKKYSDQMTVVLPNVRIMTEPRPIPGTDNAVSACIALNTWSTGDEDSKLVQFVAKGKHAEFLTAAGKGARAALTFNGPGPQATVGKDGKTYYKIDYLVGMQIHRQAAVEQPEPAEEPDDAPPPPKKAGRFGTRAI